MHVFLRHLLLLYIGRVHGAISGCTVLWEVHPASAQNKSLISDTALNIIWILLILYRHVHNIHMEGTVSQIFYLGLSFIFILKNGKI